METDDIGKIRYWNGEIMEQFVVGMELNHPYSQLSFWRPGGEEPESVSTVAGGEQYQIPARNTEEFLKRAMRLLRFAGRLGDAGAVVFSVPEASPEVVEQVKTAAMRVGIGEKKVYVQTQQESFCSYVMHQPREIHSHHVAMFSYEEDCLKAYLLILNQKRLPCLARVEEQKDWQIPNMHKLTGEERDAYFAGLIRRMFEQRIVSCAYLVGNGFEERWYEKSLQLLCAGRRVFAGSNLFAKGACYRAAELAGEAPPMPYLFFGSDKIPCNVGIGALNGQKNGIEVVIPAGVNWYEAKAECEALLYDTPVVEIFFQPLQGEAMLKESILLEGLPERPKRCTRLQVQVAFSGRTSCQIGIRDLGFGELYPATDLTWEEKVEL